MGEALVKQPSESRLYSMDFSPLLDSGETVATVTSVVSDAAGLTIGTPAASGAFAQVRISGGTSGKRYKITFVVVTSAGNTLESDGTLQVKDI